jgi:protocatechuate 3,4-dioxygenase beta subunit
MDEKIITEGGYLPTSISKREFLVRSVVGGAMLFTAPGLFAELLDLTPRQSKGPFYPNVMPLDTDNDLLILNDVITPAVGEVTHLHGKVTDVKGNPLRNALVEIWQVDNTGAYIHTRDPRNPKRDKNFQGYGRFSTGMKGEYYFRTIKPVSYPGRTPHIHVMVSHKGKRLLTTQMYIAGEERNKKDGLLRRAGDQMGALMVKFAPLEGSKVGELTAEFNIIVGVTPEDKD